MKLIKIFRLLAAALIFVVLTAAIPATPAMASGETISITNTHGTTISRGATGQVINITGSGFYSTNGTDRRGVYILFGRYPVVNNTVIDYSASIYQRVQAWELNTDGTFQTSFTIPSRLTTGSTQEDVAPGSYYIYLTYYYPAQNPGDTASNGTAVLQVAPFSVVLSTITVNPDNGAAGSQVDLNGTYFGNSEGYAVNYDGVALDFPGTGLTDSSGAFGPIKITIPHSIAGKHTISVTGNDSGTAAQATYTVKPRLIILPTSGSAGTQITALVSGFGVASSGTPSFGGDALTPATTDVFGSLTFPVFAPKKAAGNYDIVFTDASGNSANASFNLTAASLGINPVSGVAGTKVSITGSRLLPGRPISVSFNGTNVASATSDAQGAFSANFSVPALGTGTYQVKVSDGSNTNEVDFTIPATSAISPQTTVNSPGYVGSQLTITGEGFVPSGSANVSYDGKLLNTVAINADGTFSVTVSAPASAAGEHTIIATDGVNPSQTFIFVMDSTPPAAPSLLKPETGIKAAAKTFFDWQDATDPSGVTYTLQVAKNQDFLPSNILLEKTGLTISEYTLTGAEQLAPTPKETPYYWRVKATDAAGNQSDWSGTGSFYVSNFLSLSQPALYALFGVGALILAIFGFWLGRRTAYY